MTSWVQPSKSYMIYSYITNYLARLRDKTWGPYSFPKDTPNILKGKQTSKGHVNKPANLLQSMNKGALFKPHIHKKNLKKTLVTSTKQPFLRTLILKKKLVIYHYYMWFMWIVHINIVAFFCVTTIILYIYMWIAHIIVGVFVSNFPKHLSYLICEIPKFHKMPLFISLTPFLLGGENLWVVAIGS